MSELMLPTPDDAATIKKMLDKQERCDTKAWQFDLGVSAQLHGLPKARASFPFLVGAMRHVAAAWQDPNTREDWEAEGRAKIQNPTAMHIKEAPVARSLHVIFLGKPDDGTAKKLEALGFCCNTHSLRKNVHYIYAGKGVEAIVSEIASPVGGTVNPVTLPAPAEGEAPKESEATNDLAPTEAIQDIDHPRPALLQRKLKTPRSRPLTEPKVDAGATTPIESPPENNPPIASNGDGSRDTEPSGDRDDGGHQNDVLPEASVSTSQEASAHVLEGQPKPTAKSGGDGAKTEMTAAAAPQEPDGLDTAMPEADREIATAAFDKVGPAAGSASVDGLAPM
jgi:hypothetical protein